MTLHEEGEFTALTWVKPALDATLDEARQALEAHVEEPSNVGHMAECARHLHQVQGTLRMVELYGAAMVVENMERLADALVDGKVGQREEGWSVLMRGLVQLPDYLERLQAGHRDIPIVLLPLLNDLRACRGETLLSESALFSPDLEAPLPAAADGRSNALPTAELRARALRLRLGFQAALLKWFRDEGNAGHLHRLIEVLDGLRAISHDEHARRLWWIAAALVAAVENGDIEASVAVKLLLGRVDREIHRFASGGDAAFAPAPPKELQRNILYYIAHAGDSGQSPSPRVAAVRESYLLDGLLPSEAELEHAQGSMTGRNRSLLGTVSGAIKEDLLRVKETLDLFLRSGSGDPASLANQAEVLDRVGDTLGMLGLGMPRRLVGEQREAIEQLAKGEAAVDEGRLLDIAGALLYVESSLDDHIDRLGAETEPEVEEGRLPAADLRNIVGALMGEAAVNLQRTKQAFIAFIESPWDHDQVHDIPRLLEEISGALRMLGLLDAGDLMDAIVRFVQVELISHRRVPTTEQMDTLADAVSAVEYYLEATRDQQRNRNRILEVARGSLGALGYWPLPEDGAGPTPAGDEPVEPTGSVAGAMPRVDVLPGDSLDDLIVGEALSPARDEIDLSGFSPAEAGGVEWHDAGASAADAIDGAAEPTPVEPSGSAGATPAEPATGFVSGFDPDIGGELGDDIREIFVEEVEEELAGLRENFPVWQANPADMDLLVPIRRAFHTLKGSGRLVGARTLGEFSWKIESLLNRVLDGSLAPGAPVSALVSHAIDAVPDMLRALQGEQVPDSGIAAIEETAVRLGRGEDAWLPVSPAAAAPPVPDEAAPVAHVDPESGPAAAAAGNALADVDPVLFEILQSEVSGHLATIEEELASGAGERPSEALLRATHTLNGAIAMVEIAPIGRVLAPLESWLKRKRASETVLASDEIGLIAEAVEVTRTAISRLADGGEDLPDSGSLAARLVALRDALPEPSLPVWETGDALPSEERVVDGSGDEAGPAPVGEQPWASGLPEGLEEALAAFRPDETAAGAPPAGPDPEHTGGDGQDQSHHWIESEDAPGTSPDETAIPAGEDIDESDWFSGFGPTPVAADATEGEGAPAGAEGTPQSPAPAVGAGEPTLPTALFGAELSAPAGAEPELPEPELPEPELPEPELPEPELPEPELPEPELPEPESATPAVLAGAEPPPIAADVQPDGTLDLEDADDELLGIFVQEGTDLLDHADSLMAQLRIRPDDHSPIPGLQRDLHTLKGGARMAGLAAIGDLSHAMESLVDAIAEHRITVDLTSVAALEHGFDLLHQLVQRVAWRKAIAMPVHAITRLEQLVAGEVPQAAPETDAVAPADPVTGEAPAADPAAGPTPVQRRLTAMDRLEVARAPLEQTRVRSDLLDSLVNLAGEVSIYRSRLEQQVAGFSFNLVELDQTVARLREQLRQLEIETEAQIIARFQREQHEEGVFDPLELDRFSQLQQLSRALSESVADLVSIQGLLDDQTRQSETLLLQQSRVSSELQEGLMRTRMVPFDSMVPSLRRTVRQAAQDLDRRAQLEVTGADGEMDRNLLERMKAPLEHMLRNALAHGIESPGARLLAGKPAEGTVRIRVSREATEVVLQISDDGRGLDREAIRSKAIERGLLKPGVELSDRDIYGFVLEAGFSTAGELTQVSGRGVGMDVVYNEIKQLGGGLTIDSTPGKGASFTVRLPFTLAVTQAILVRLGEASYAIPLSSVQGVARINRPDLEARLEAGENQYAYGGEDYAIHDLAQLLGVARSRVGEEDQVPLLVMRAGDQRAAVRVDSVIGSREVVVKSVGPQLSSVPGIFGATIMGDGSVVIILDLAPLVRRITALRADGGEEPVLPLEPLLPEPETRQRARIMVVDDSITMRRVTSRVLERADFEVLTAKDGLDAVEKLQEGAPDLMLLDIEMPRMDGYELATYMRNDSRLREVPIIMITSRTGEKHRQRALEIGVERYLGKPYQEDDLLRHVAEVLGRD